MWGGEWLLLHSTDWRWLVTLSGEFSWLWPATGERPAWRTKWDISNTLQPLLTTLSLSLNISQCFNNVKFSVFLPRLLSGSEWWSVPGGGGSPGQVVTSCVTGVKQRKIFMETNLAISAPLSFPVSSTSRIVTEGDKYSKSKYLIFLSTKSMLEGK